MSATDSTKTIFVLDIARPEDQPYMVLESDIECPSKAIHILNFGAKKTFNIGRRVTNDISISDISVSRDHASISCFDKQVFCKDNNSKFGTFKKIIGLLKLPRDGRVFPIQIEKACFFLQAKSRFSGCNRCLTSCLPSNSDDKESFDHFLQVYNKYPLCVQYHLFPFLLELAN
jgi:hypothetical protein